MDNNHYIVSLRKGMKPDLIGNKAASLAFLKHHGFTIPLTYVVTTKAFSDSFADPGRVLNALKKEIGRLPDLVYAIRSSTTLEDDKTYTHAGQFLTLTHVRSVSSVLHAVQEVWKSVEQTSGSEYRKITDQHGVTVKCAVIVQQMIRAELSGVCFSKDPVNNEHVCVIEAVEGDGEKLVQKGETPMRWKVRDGKIIQGDGAFPRIKLIRQVADAAEKLQMRFGGHVDFEWIYDGSKLCFLQVRSITSGDNQVIYSSKMAAEMLPGQIKPLVWSVNIPLVNGTWIDIISRITGKTDVRPEDLAKSFYYRTYFNVTILGRLFGKFGIPVSRLEEMMLSEEKVKHTFSPGLETFRHTFRIIRFIHVLLRFEKFFVREYSALSVRYNQLADMLEDKKAKIPFEKIYHDLFSEGKRLTYLNIIIPLLMRIYHQRFTRRLKKKGMDYHHIDFNADFPELEELSPLVYFRKIREKLDKLGELTGQEVNSLRDLKNISGSDEIVADFYEVIRRFGHFSESGNDFSYPKWEEDEAFVFRMIRDHINDKPHPEESSGIYNLSSNPGRRLKKAWLKAGRFKVYREQISSLYIYGYGLFRKLFLKVGEEMVLQSLIDDRNDIFYLNLEEILPLMKGEPTPVSDSFRQKISLRKSEMEATKDLRLPVVIYGDDPPLPDTERNCNTYGVGTSPGTFRGKVKVVKSVADFDKVIRGDVVVIPFSDVSWTPILIRAGAIVSESGGMLSHCSIIARELRIPAVVSIGNACGMNDGLDITVNGSHGLVTLHDYE